MRTLSAFRRPARLAASGLALAALLGSCDDGPTGRTSGGLYPSYFLASVDGQPLPAPTANLPEGWLLVAAHLAFPRDGGRPHGSVIPGLVTFTQIVRDAQGGEQTFTSQLSYSFTDAQLQINLCPRGALCFVPTELIGPAEGTEITLTHFFAGQPKNVYRFGAVLPD